MKIQPAFVLLAAVTAAASTGCGDGDKVGSPSVGTTRASLHRAKGCGDLLADLKADAKYKLDRAIDRQILEIQKCIARDGEASCAYYGGGVGFGSRDAATAGGVPSPVSAPTAPPQAGDSNSESAGEKAGSYSETNTQVKGVDEADFVKTDGTNLYVIHGRAFKVLKAWPATDLSELSTLDIEGQPSEMFVDGGKVVVYSQVNGASLYAQAGVTPKEIFTDYGYGNYGGGSGGVARTTDMAAPYPGTPGSGTPYVPLTKITVLTLNGAIPTVAREMYFEGSYLDSRRVGSHVRTVLSGYAHGPKLKYGIYELYPEPVNATAEDAAKGTPTTNPYPETGTEMISALEQLRSTNRAIVDASTLDQWLPYTFVKEGAAVSAQSVACSDFYVPSAGSTASGITEVASIGLANPAALPKQTAILGHAETVYGSADTLYLAASAWIEPPYVWYDSGSVTGGGTAASPPPNATPPVEPMPAPDAPVGTKSIRPLNGTAGASTVTAYADSSTHLHKFEFKTDATFPNYVASGTVVGRVKDQFSLDDKDGHLRVATTESRIYVDADQRWVEPSRDPAAPGDRPQSVNHVFVLGENGGWLDKEGDVGPLAPNEQIYSVRFVEHRGYVVTFRRVDPLFVLDLTNPAAPTKLAELKIPGFSEYMHPLDATHILTIGRDATSTGQAQGLQLQIFDVADGANPILQHKFTYSGSEYGSSEAEQDHKAFTYFADKKLLAFPYYSYGTNMRSSLELFKVDLGAGFSKVGSIDHTDLVSSKPQGYCGGYYGPQVRRGVFLENFVYSVSYGGVVVKDANDLAALGAKLPLSSPVSNPGYGPDCAY